MKIFSIPHTRRERQIFITGYEGQRERPRYKGFLQTQASPPTEHALVFFRLERFLPESDSELTEQPLVSSVPTRYADRVENETPSSHHRVWVGHS